MKYSNEQVKVVTNFVDEALGFLREKMHLQKIDILKYMVDEDGEGEGGRTIFSIRYSPTYRKAHLKMWNVCIETYYEQYGKGTIFDALVHEMCHLITTPLSDCAMDRHSTLKEIKKMDEGLTEDIAILLRPSYAEEFFSKVINKNLKQPYVKSAKKQKSKPKKSNKKATNKNKQ